MNAENGFDEDVSCLFTKGLSSVTKRRKLSCETWCRRNTLVSGGEKFDS